MQLVPAAAVEAQRPSDQSATNRRLFILVLGGMHQEAVHASDRTIHGITRERITLPGDIGGWLEGRSRFARLGLMIHV